MKIERFYADELNQTIAQIEKEAQQARELLPPEEQEMADKWLSAGFQKVLDRVNRRKYNRNNALHGRFLHAANAALDLAKQLHLNIVVETKALHPGTITLSAESIELLEFIPADVYDRFFTLLTSANYLTITKDSRLVYIRLAYNRYDITDE